MSERYGTIDEVYFDKMPDFEKWVRGGIDQARDELKQYGGPNAEHSYNAGRLDALRDVLSWWRVDD